jgi:hypothetical protein
MVLGSSVSPRSVPTFTSCPVACTRWIPLAAAKKHPTSVVTTDAALTQPISREMRRSGGQSPAPVESGPVSAVSRPKIDDDEKKSTRSSMAPSAKSSPASVGTRCVRSAENSGATSGLVSGFEYHAVSRFSQSMTHTRSRVVVMCSGFTRGSFSSTSPFV